MPKLAMAPPCSPVEPVTEIMHGVTITDPYRWLEDQDSPRTREWLGVQHEYARSYLDSIPGRNRIRERIRELLDVETYDSVQKVGQRYFFRKRLPGQEQPCVYFREGAAGTDQLLIDPSERGTGAYTAVKPLKVSPNGRLLFYEVKEGGERTGTFELLDIQARTKLPDGLPRGYLRGFSFSQDSKSFYYVHEPVRANSFRAAYRHILGTTLDTDQEVFFAGEDKRLQLYLTVGFEQLGFLLLRYGRSTLTDFFLWQMESDCKPEAIFRNATYKVGPILLKDRRILAITDREAPNFRIVEVHPQAGQDAEFTDIVSESDAVIHDWAVVGDQICVSYFRNLKSEVDVFNLSGDRIGRMPLEPSDTVRLLASDDCDELLFERESFTKPIQLCRYSPATGKVNHWANRLIPFDSKEFDHNQVWLTGKDGTPIPMFLVGRRDVLENGSHPTIMTSYGGYGVPMTPQFSVLVAFLLESGCIFALPNIRGGSEFGASWHERAKRRKRQVSFDDFISAADWLIRSGRTEPNRLAIFGGSNSGLLVGAALAQRPEMFRAVLCMVPMLDMLRYHLFDNARVWEEELGTADDPDDFAALLDYSPYHNIRHGVAYPATMIVSGDSDQNCNSLHARKMTAWLQTANISGSLIFLDYSQHRGHSPVLPLCERVEALSDRIAFLCDSLRLVV